MAAALFVFQYGAGSVIWLSHKYTGESVKDAVVQGNISSHEKWDASSSVKTRLVYEQYTREAAEKGAKIVVWPETALPYTIQKGSSYYRFAANIAMENNVTILVGAFSRDENDAQYNSIICFTPDGRALDNV